MENKWELFSHEADMGIRGKGFSFEKAFEEAGLALTGVLTDPMQIKPEIKIQLSCFAPKMDTLFYDWINELVYEMASQHLIFGQYQVKITQEVSGTLHLEGTAWGEKINLQKHKLAVEVKGATFTELKAEKLPTGNYVVQCVVDV